jgi:uncharacterized membrane protein YgaE (UPF0421/DUF939 family)
MTSRDVLELAAERSRVGLRDRIGRLTRLAPMLLLAAVAAGIAWLLATEVVGHPRGFFAPVAALITLGLTYGQRLRRAVEVSVGVALGIAIADLLVIAIGSGTWQLVLVVMLAMTAAILLGGGPMLVQQAAVSAALVVTLQPPSGGFSFSRSIDALVGAGVALVLTFVIAPVDPLALVRREAFPVLRELAGVLRDVAGALRDRSREDAVAALMRARDMDDQLERFAEALSVGRETAAAAPPRRAAREPLAVYAEAAGQLDLAVRNVRVLARGAIRAIDVGDHVPDDVAVAIDDLGQAVAAMVPWLEDARRADAVREPAVQAARLASAVLEQTANLSVSVMVGQVRSTAVDLLRGTGMTPEQARSLVRGEEAPTLPAA